LGLKEGRKKETERGKKEEARSKKEEGRRCHSHSMVIDDEREGDKLSRGVGVLVLLMMMLMMWCCCCYWR